MFEGFPGTSPQHLHAREKQNDVIWDLTALFNEHVGQLYLNTQKQKEPFPPKAVRKL